jgi:CubicO group peptidase (beta-lactamase class C family)
MKIAVVALLFFPLPLLAGEPPAGADKEVNALLEPIRDKYKMPGLVAALVRGDRVLALGAVGVRKHGSPEPITVHDQIHIGSCTKAMTATLLALLVQEKKLRWDSTLGEVFTEDREKLHPDYRKVTLSQLLTHRASLPANVIWWALGRDEPTTRQRYTLLRTVLARAPKIEPGTEFHYSNVGYAVAGLMAEHVTGRSWEALMRERLFEPLGMKSAGFGPPGTKGKVDQPWGHFPGKEGPRPRQADNAPVLGPAGTVHCTLSDWAKFIALHLQKSEGKTRLLTAASLRRLHTPPAEGRPYAFGWLVFERDWAAGKALTHAGSNKMWFAVAWLAPERNFAVLVATNVGGDEAREGCDEAVGALVDLYRKRSVAP